MATTALLLLLFACLVLSILPTLALVSPVPSNANNKELRLVSWNLLAPNFCPPNKYPWCPPEFLSWPFREKLIRSELDRIDADIVCLQEVQTDVWDEFLDGFDGKYEGILQNVTNGHPVTNAILLRRDKFRVAKQESRSRALILVLDQCCNDEDDDCHQSGSQPLYLANVHLQAGLKDDETRVCQLKSLLKRLAFHSKTEEKSDSMHTSKKNTATSSQELPPAVVIVGDFNMLPTNPVYRWLSHKEHETASSTSATQEAPKVHMRDSGTGLKLSNLKFPARGKHVELLPLADVYRDMPPALVGADHEECGEGRPIRMTYCGGSVLDYIWTTTTAAFDSATTTHSIEVSKTMAFHPEAFKDQRQQWPSKDHPSDHVPVGFEFTWR